MADAVRFYMDQHFPSPVSRGLLILVHGAMDADAMRNHVEYL